MGDEKSPSAKAKYLPTIGIECHVQLKTKTKLFSAVANDARQAPANTLISHIDLGMPGALPVLNEQAVHYALRMAYAFNVEPQKHSFFERKHYFYPDLPKGYQITQLSQPIIKGGYVELEDGTNVQLDRVQMEEDAGKNIHPPGQDYSLVDLNRAGTPLLEIVSQPDMHSAAQAKAYARELYLLVRYAGVSDADLYHGNMRFDVNVSLSTKSDELGIRTETKNLNSFRSVEKAVEYEIKRQTEELDKGRSIIQETRGWDDAKQKTFSQRGKEEAHDYRYMPEPDIPPLELTSEMTVQAQKELPILPNEWRKRLSKLGLSKSHSETLLEAELEYDDITFLTFIEEALKENAALARQEANLMVNVEIPLMRELGPALVPQSAKWALVYKPITELVNENKLSSTNAKALIKDLFSKDLEDTLRKNMWSDKTILEIAESRGYLQISDEEEISKIAEKVVADNPKAAEAVKNGELKAIGFLVGQVMQASQGAANPQLAQELIKRLLGI